MADILRYLTHPQVEIDPDILVPQWGLSKIGTRRSRNLSAPAALASRKRMVSSGEKKAIEAVLSSHAEGGLLIVGHGAVGTLLYCHFANLPIDRKYDQMAGGGNFFAMDIASQQILHNWRAMEEM